MGQVYTFTAEGQGGLSLDGGAYVHVLELAASIVTPATHVVLTGTSPVRRVHKQCAYGIGLLPNAGPLDGIYVPTLWYYLEMETESRLTDPFAAPYADSIWWDVAPGGVMFFEADW